ncbi:hypothetical protein MTO96_010389 [Rhipicephalus appendiculatus]
MHVPQAFPQPLNRSTHAEQRLGFAHRTQLFGPDAKSNAALRASAEVRKLFSSFPIGLRRAAEPRPRPRRLWAAVLNVDSRRHISTARALDILWDGPAAAGAYLPRSAAAASSTPADPTPQSPRQTNRRACLETKLASLDGGGPSLVLRRPGYAILCSTNPGCSPCGVVEGSGTTTSMIGTRRTTTTSQSNFRDWPGARCFRHAGFHSSTSEAASGSTSPQHEQEAASPSCWEEFRRRDEVAADQNFDDFVNSDADAKEDLDDEEIVQLVSGAQEEPEDANGPDTVEAPVPTLSQVMDAVDLLRRFAGAHEGAEERFDFTVQL